ncbi:MAG: hypothetical protein ACRDRW_02610 [Pseudonocardiaceae bacterium]
MAGKRSDHFGEGYGDHDSVRVEDDPEDEYHHLARVHDPITGSWATVDVHRGPAAQSSVTG